MTRVENLTDIVLTSPPSVRALPYPSRLNIDGFAPGLNLHRSQTSQPSISEISLAVLSLRCCRFGEQRKARMFCGASPDLPPAAGVI